MSIQDARIDPSDLAGASQATAEDESELTEEERAVRAQALNRLGEIHDRLQEPERWVVRPAREVETRSVAAMEVRFAERMIDIIAVPYDEPTKVMYHDRWIDEVITRGAFEGVQMRKFPVNRAHDLERPIGWANKLRPRDERGLVAEIGPLRPTRDGDDALELAADGLLGASIGFMIKHATDEEWTLDRGTRRIRKAWLDHIALTGSPAYPGAKVLAVRSTPEPPPVPTSATPNLDRVLAELMADRYSRNQPST